MINLVQGPLIWWGLRPLVNPLMKKTSRWDCHVSTEGGFHEFVLVSYIVEIMATNSSTMGRFFADLHAVSFISYWVVYTVRWNKYVDKPNIQKLCFHLRYTLIDPKSVKLRVKFLLSRSRQISYSLKVSSVRIEFSIPSPERMRSLWRGKKSCPLFKADENWRWSPP